jgi:hypothetical protein
MTIIPRIAAALPVLVLVALAAAAPTSAYTRVHHTVKHPTHVTRQQRLHHHPAGVLYGQPVHPVPSAYQGYHYGGPLYSTCDRINADRMLVGTCR